MTRLSVLAGLVLAVASTATAAPARSAFRVRVVNTSPQVIREVYLAPTGSQTWGPNLLGVRPLRPGQRVTVPVDSRCGTYDVRLVAVDGRTEYLDEDVEFCGDDVLTVGRGDLKRTRPLPVPVPASDLP